MVINPGLIVPEQRRKSENRFPPRLIVSEAAGMSNLIFRSLDALHPVRTAFFWLAATFSPGFTLDVLYTPISWKFHARQQRHFL